ncbi:hypothetical protein XENORESO_001116 [Xenotaenia resolanae]|uniref:Uncharacterized protein n=1 Tax=Xenotaenia resolanae TaxID=208358 RepID=A0ABV0VWQ6_9TELE
MVSHYQASAEHLHAEEVVGPFESTLLEQRHQKLAGQLPLKTGTGHPCPITPSNPLAFNSHSVKKCSLRNSAHLQEADPTVISVFHKKGELIGVGVPGREL